MEEEDSVGGLSCAQTCFVVKDYEEVLNLIQQISDVKDSQQDFNKDAEKLLERYQYILDLYLEQRHLLDPKIPEILGKLLALTEYKGPVGRNLTVSNILAYKFIWGLCQVRKHKVITKFFPHETDDFIPVVSLLETENLDLDAACVLLLWMKLLCKIPFDLSRFDAQNKDKSMVIQRLIKICKSYVESNTRCGDLSAQVFCELVIRPDVKKQHLIREINESIDRICALDLSKRHDQIQAIARVTFLADVFKHANREDVQIVGKEILNKLDGSKLYSASELLLRKLSCKLVQRIAMVFLPQKIASWRYNRGLRSLAHNLAVTLEENEGEVGCKEIEEEEEYNVNEEVEMVIGLLLGWLNDNDTVVRWSAAKGLGRVTGRLPLTLANEVTNGILGLLGEGSSASVWASAWHGACLAIAELAIRGLILPHNLSPVIHVVITALTYDKQYGRHSVGNHVRDAACYVCWAFARAFHPSVMAPYVKQIATSLITVAVFDREVNCRRAASAAFQENVGRQGNFSHGIDIVTVADFFAVGNRINCYSSICVQIAKFEEYRQCFTEHILQYKIGHWDIAIRKLASISIGRLCDLCPGEFVSVLESLVQKAGDNDVLMRHGAMHAIGDVYSALVRNNVSICSCLLKSIAEIPGNCHKYLKNLGGELTRYAVNYLIQKLASAKFPIFDIKREEFAVWMSTIRDGLRNQDEAVRASSNICVKPMSYYLLDEKSPISPMDYINESFKRIRTPQETESIGGIASLGYMNIEVMKEGAMVDQVVQILTQHTVVAAKHDSLWAEARMHALQAMDMIMSSMESVDSTLFSRLAKVYVKALEDYTLDTRGDIGKIVRVAAIQGLKNLLLVVMKWENRKQEVDFALVDQIMASVLQQCCEKIDSVREISCNTMMCLVSETDLLDCLQLDNHSQQTIVHVFTNCQHIKWLSGKEAFITLKPLLNTKYQPSVLLGFIISAGCITESTRKSASDALLDFVKDICDDENALRLLLDVIANLFEDNQSIDRVITPLLACLDILLSSGFFEVFYANSDQVPALELILRMTLTVTCRKRSPVKVIAGLTICSCMMQFMSESKVYDLAVRQLLRSMTHPFPVVRKEAANILYGGLLTYGNLDNHSEQCITLLTESQWDSQDISALKEIRAHIMQMLRIQAS